MDLAVTFKLTAEAEVIKGGTSEPDLTLETHDR